MYYPQDVSEEMGATAILPGSQYLLDKEDADWPEIKLTCRAGTVVVTHYDTYHRATQNVSDKMRYMMKYIVWRRSEPATHSPSWLPGDGIELHGMAGGLAARPWRPPAATITAEMPFSTVIWRTVWEWYTCKTESAALDEEEALEEEATAVELTAALSSASLAERRLAADRAGALRQLSLPLQSALGRCLLDPSTDGQLRMLAAYSLGRGGGVTELTEALRREAQAVAAGRQARFFNSTLPLAGHADDDAKERPFDAVRDSAPPGAAGHTWRNPGQVKAVTLVTCSLSTFNVCNTVTPVAPATPVPGGRRLRPGSCWDCGRRSPCAVPATTWCGLARGSRGHHCPRRDGRTGRRSGSTTDRCAHVPVGMGCKRRSGGAWHGGNC